MKDEEMGSELCNVISSLRARLIRGVLHFFRHFFYCSMKIFAESFLREILLVNYPPWMTSKKAPVFAESLQHGQSFIRWCHE